MNKALADHVFVHLDLTVCTIAQLGYDMIKRHKFDITVVDEASVSTAILGPALSERDHHKPADPSGSDQVRT